MPKSVGRSTSSDTPGVLTQQISLSPNTPNNGSREIEEKLSFWDLLDEVPEEDWWSGTPGEKGTRVYLYDLNASGSYLDVINHAFDIEWIKQKYKGGRYRAQLNPITGKATSTTFSIDGDPRKPVLNVQNAPAAALPTDSFQSSVLQLISDGQRRSEQLIERLIDRDRAPVTPAAFNPMEMFMPMMQGMITMFSGIIKENHAPPPPPQPSLMEMLALADKLRGPDLLTVLTQAKTAGLIPDVSSGGSMIEQLSGLMAVAEKLGLSQSGGGKSLSEVLIEKGPDILKVFSDGIEKYRLLEAQRLETARFIASQQQRPAVQQHVPPVANGQARVIQAAPQQSVTPGPAASTARPLDVEPIGQQVPVSPGEAQQVIELTEAQFNQMKANMVNAIRQKLTGVDIFSYLRINAPVFLDNMCHRDGTGKVIGVVSTDELAAFCASDPILGQAMNFPNFRSVLDELLGEVRAETLGDGEE